MLLSFGNTLKSIRLAKNYSQSQLAKKIGISSSMISQYENSARMPSFEILIAMSKAFSVSTDYLLGLEGNSEGFEFSQLTQSQINAVCLMIDEFRKANSNE